MKVSYYSLGCKVNLYETTAIINQFIDHGFEVVSFNDVSDVYIINTCSVTSMSDQKSRKIIRQAIKRNPEAIIAVMGCYSQLKPDDIREIPGVDIIIGTSNRDKLFDYVMAILDERKVIDKVDDYRTISTYEELKIDRYNNKSRGFVKIQDGCENFCNYCTIPYARGKVRSRNADEVVSEIQTLTNTGLREIVLTGINTGAYGTDLEGFTFANLLEKIVREVDNLGRIRISSIEVTEVNDDVLKVISENKEHFCNHFHVPIQGGCDNTLKNMGRKYDIDTYISTINKIREIFPDVNITTDIMAGFCGETSDDFLKTLDFVYAMRYGEMHVFPYSKRPLTKAYTMPNHVDEISKRIRTEDLLAANRINALEYRKYFEGKVLEVVIEKVKGNTAFGHSSNYLEVEFSGNNLKLHEIRKVYIQEAGYPISRGIAL